jgi:general secretion pathway protein G
MIRATLHPRSIRAFSRRIANEDGMTLLEVLVVMAILGLVATLGSVQLINYLGRAKTGTARLQIQELATAIDLFRIDVGRVPSAAEGLIALVEPPAGVKPWRGPYMRKRSALNDPWGRVYLYKTPGNNREYEIASFGADGRAGGDNENSDVAN